MSYIDNQISELNKKLKNLRKEKRLSETPQLSLKDARDIRKELREMEKRSEGLWEQLRHGCPHTFVNKESHSEPDCDGLFGGSSYWKECTICGTSVDRKETP